MNNQIIFACDAGMGSSAMAASMLKVRVKELGIPVEVISSSVSEIPVTAQIVVSHQGLTDLAKKKAPNAEHVSIRDYFNDPKIDQLLRRLQEGYGRKQHMENNKDILKIENIRLNLDSVSKNEAIKIAGKILVESGYVDEQYIDAMLEREEQLSTYIGKGVAIPHGVGKSKETIKKSGIVFLQFPQGIQFGQEKAHMIIGIAGKDNEHLEILSNLASALDEDETVRILQTTDNVEDVYRILTTAEED